MKKFFVILLSAVFILPQSCSFAADKPCSKSLVGKTKSGSVCTKVGSLYRWKELPKTIEVPVKTQQPTPTETSKPTVDTTQNFKSQCELDNNVPSEWKEYQIWALKRENFGCARPYRFVKKYLTTEAPVSEISKENVFSSLDQCKVSNRGQRVRLDGTVRVQVLPIQFNDYETDSSPVSDYGKYFDYISDGLLNSSDGITNFKFTVPNKYFKMGSSMSSYSLPGSVSHGPGWVWDKQDTVKYSNDIISSTDPHVDFSNIDYVFIVVPKSVPSKYVAHGANDFNILKTNEKTITSIYRMPPVSMVDRMSWYGVEPFLHLHEVMHPIGAMNDHDADNAGKDGPDAGAGYWGHMSGMMMDFLSWDKWKAGMMKDSQVKCLDTNQTTTTWLKPASLYGQYEKLLIIKVSKTKFIAIESMRSYGFNYKVPKSTNGALVYVIDSAITKNGYGLNVIRPESRTGSIFAGPFPLSDAALKLNDSISLYGYEISVIESGEFGDIVKVKKQ